MPAISVIIPNYNRAHLIPETVENVLGQSFADTEIIVVDDGSSDNSVSLLRERFGDRILVLEQENQGPGAARNHGLQHATGDYIKFLDSDDLCTLNLLESQYTAAEAAKADFCYAPWLRVGFDEGKRDVTVDNYVMQQDPLPASVSPVSAMLAGWTVIFQACLIRRSFIESSDGYRNDMLNYEDAEFLFRLMLQEPVMAFAGEGLIVYRYHSSDRLSEEGVSTPRKRRDAVLLSSCMAEALAKSYQHPPPRYRLLFEGRRDRAIGEFHHIADSLSPDASLPFSALENRPNAMKKIAIRSAEVLDRIETRSNSRRTGSPWPTLFGSRPTADKHKALLEGLAFNVHGQEALCFKKYIPIVS